MGKVVRNTILGASLVGLCFLGWCNRSAKINEKEDTIAGLETRIKKDSVYSELLKDKIVSYSDSIHELSVRYNKNFSNNEKLNKRVSELSKLINKNNFLK